MDKAKEKIEKLLLELIFPSFCLGCQKEGFYLCYDCQSTLEISEYSYCLCNKNPLRLPTGNKNGKCSRCYDKKLSGLFSALPYKEKYLTRKLIHQFKYQPHIKELAKTLAGILMEHFTLISNNSAKYWQEGCLMPVPMEKKRMKNRGYNQAEELAKELSKILEIPLIKENLIKTKKTLPQIELSAKEREENIKGAFLVKKPEEIKRKKIFLVDDVYTTGSTMEECTRILKEAGAKSVWGIAVAREG